MDVCKEDNKEEFLARFAGDILAREQAWEERLVQTRPGPVDKGIFIAALAGILFFALVFPGYPFLWIAASLFTIMFYPLTIVLPSAIRLATAGSGTTVREYVRMLRRVGIIRHRDNFVFVLWNAFFINSQPLAVPIILLCVSDLVTALLLLVFEIHPFRIILIIVGQSVVIVIYYLSILYLKPYSDVFLERVRSMRKHFHQRGYRVFLLVAATGVLGFILTMSAFLTFLFPGITVWEIMNEGRLDLLKDFGRLILVILVQYVIVRFMHGIFSRGLIVRINRGISRYITTEVLPALDHGPAGLAGREGDPYTCEDYREIATRLIEAKMYKTGSASIFGYFIIYFIQPDLSLILEKETLDSLRGHMEIRT
ncbi:hypothetical protein J2741_002607 [Methanolinea mesophila]|uniref:hypothetical protein n=1 Tax=Methanolinea mesophila TaxID=547055 RepID=UPI001AE17349|nr:hypothetical protein [Methanolinea mesophila]MBP1930011.1 hypothetical protein [Methanolinea mesophila]